MKKIADISHYQGNIDWDKAREELEFVIFRASVGNNADKKYLAYTAVCGVPYGAYHYVKAGTAEDARTEARFFVECANRAAKKPLFYIADIEYKAQTQTTTEAVCVAFLEELRALGCEKIGLYINTRYKWAGAAIGMCDIMWTPHWGKNDGNVPADNYKPKHYCDIWQYTSNGTLAGVKGRVDLNQLEGDKPLSYFTTSEQEKTNPERSDAPMLTNIQLVQYCLAVFAAKWVYWYGTCGYECTTSLYNRKKKQYPKHYTNARESGYKADIAAGKMCADCVGLIKSFFWKGGDLNGANKYGANNCPDRSANGMFGLCKETGKIGTIPDIPGLVVWRDGHIGVYVGGGYTVELKGFSYDCVKNKVTSGTWTHWGKLPPSMLAYGNSEAVIPSCKLGDRILEKGDEGDDVAELQAALVKLGYDLGTYGANKDGVDGDYGNKTVEAVKAYQTANGLTVNGKYDEATHAVMSGAAPAPEQPEPPQTEPVQPTDGKKIVVIKCNNGKVNIRRGDSTDYPSIKQVTDGTTFEYVATSPTGWHGIRYKTCIAWVSPKFSVVTDR